MKVVMTDKSWSRRNPDSRRFVLILPVSRRDDEGREFSRKAWVVV